MNTVKDPAPLNSLELPPVLSVELRVEGDAAVLGLSGALTGQSIAALDAQVDQLGACPCSDVVVQADQLTHLDSVGTDLLKGLQNYTWARGGRFRIRGLRPALSAVLTTAGLISDSERQ